MSSLLLLSALVNPASAAGPARQAPTPIAYGQTARNLINHRHHGWTYIFEARRGDLVTLTVTRLDGDLDPYVVLQDFYGNPIAEDDDSGENTNARLEYGIRESGRYLIFITRFQGEKAPSAGRFELSVEGVPDGVFGPPPVGYEQLRYGVSASNVLAPEQSEVGYTFVGWRGDTITLTLARRDGDLTPALAVYLPGSVRPFLDIIADEDGRIQAEGVVLPRTGYYTLRIAPGASGGATASYQVALDGTPGVAPERGDGVVAAPLSVGEVVQGNLSADAPEQYFTFAATASQFVRARLAVTDGDLRPLLLMLDADGVEVAFDDTPLTAEITQARLPHTGDFTLVAGRLGGDGSFTLTLQTLSGDTLALTDGAISVTLRWEGAADLDLIVRDPTGDALTPETRRVASGGVFEVDANAGCTPTFSKPVEHAYWPDGALPGVYEAIVWHRAACAATGPVAFELVIAVAGVEVAHAQDELATGAQYRITFPH